MKCGGVERIQRIKCNWMWTRCELLLVVVVQPNATSSVVLVEWMILSNGKHSNKQNKPVDNFAFIIYYVLYSLFSVLLCYCYFSFLSRQYSIFIDLFIFSISIFVHIGIFTRTIQSFNFVMIFDFRYF